MVEMLRESVIIGYVHPNMVHEGFMRSVSQACLWNDNKIVGLISASSPRQHVARNSVIEKFLDGPAEWLMWIDTDMTFEPQAIERLRKTAKKKKYDAVTGLGFIFKRQDNIVIPNGYLWDKEISEFSEIDDYESGKVYSIDGTGSGFVLINRRVLQSVDGNWHENWMHHPSNDGPMGHDLAFFWEACVNQDFNLGWDTNVKTGHIKYFELDENSFRNYQKTLK